MMTKTMGLEDAVTRCKKIVYKNRIRLQEFFVDFDKLRCGLVHPNHFVTALSIAGLDRYISPQEIEEIKCGYTCTEQDGLHLVQYKRFCEDIDTVFTVKGLEEDPLRAVPGEPIDLLDKTRFQKSSRHLSPEEREILTEEALYAISDICKKKGILVKPMFDDAAANNNSSKLVGHVTRHQFAQCLNVKLGLELTADELDVLVGKYKHEDFDEMVNYVAFANTVDPPEDAFDPYKLR